MDRPVDFSKLMATRLKLILWSTGIAMGLVVTMSAGWIWIKLRWSLIHHSRNVSEWIEASKAALPARWRSVPHLTAHPLDLLVVPPAPHPPSATLIATGVPEEYMTTPDPYPDLPRLTSFESGDTLYTFAKISKGLADITGVLLATRNGSTRRVLEIENCEVRMEGFRPGPRAPIMITVFDSGCGSGWREHLYLPLENGDVKRVASVAGWHPQLHAIDVEGDGIYELVHAAGMASYPADLQRLIDAESKSTGEDTEETGGVKLWHCVILRWTGATFEEVGEYYDWWVE